MWILNPPKVKRWLIDWNLWENSQNFRSGHPKILDADDQIRCVFIKMLLDSNQENRASEPIYPLHPTAPPGRITFITILFNTVLLRDEKYRKFIVIQSFGCCNGIVQCPAIWKLFQNISIFSLPWMIYKVYEVTKSIHHHLQFTLECRFTRKIGHCIIELLQG